MSMLSIRAATPRDRDAIRKVEEHAFGQPAEALSVVLGDPAYYGRFGYSHTRATGFESEYQGDALQALTWGEAPETGRLVYPAAFTTELAA